MGQMLVGPQGMIDLAAITSGIQAIQRTQASIGADLKALQSSNEHLWREAMEQREKHKKHQETIDLIVSFLERLFGTDGEGLKGLKEAMRRSGLARGRDEEGVVGMGMNMGMGMESGKKRRRLGLDRMIGDGREGDGAFAFTFPTPSLTFDYEAHWRDGPGYGQQAGHQSGTSSGAIRQVEEVPGMGSQGQSYPQDPAPSPLRSHHQAQSHLQQGMEQAQLVEIADGTFVPVTDVLAAFQPSNNPPPPF